jgi:hypothetical protein
MPHRDMLSHAPWPSALDGGWWCGLDRGLASLARPSSGPEDALTAALRRPYGVPEDALALPSRCLVVASLALALDAGARRWRSTLALTSRASHWRSCEPARAVALV